MIITSNTPIAFHLVSEIRDLVVSREGELAIPLTDRGFEGFGILKGWHGDDGSRRVHLQRCKHLCGRPQTLQLHDME